MTDSQQKIFSGNFFTDMVKAVSVISSILAIVYLYGFGLTAKVNILAYVGLTDFLRVAVGWIVPTLGLLCLGNSLGFLCTPYFVKATAILPETEGGDNCLWCKYERFASKGFNFAITVLALTIVILIIDIWCNLNIRFIIYHATSVVILVHQTALLWYFKSAKNIVKCSFNMFISIYTVPILLIASFGLGLAHGALPDKANSFCEIVQVSTVNGSPLCGDLLFYFDKFVIIRESGHADLTFVPSDKITSIRTPVSIFPSLRK